MPIQVFAYDADGRDDVLDFEQLDRSSFGDHKLVWIDVSGEEETALGKIAEKLEVEGEPLTAAAADVENLPQNFGPFLRFSVDTAPGLQQLEAATRHSKDSASSDPQADGRVVFFLSDKWLVTVHDKEVDFLRRFRDQDQIVAFRRRRPDARDHHRDTRYYSHAGGMARAEKEMDLTTVLPEAARGIARLARGVIRSILIVATPVFAQDQSLPAQPPTPPPLS